jgi:hypothetical protein
MPKFTKNLQLPYFYYGDNYSAYFDRLRFTSIDSYFNGLSNSIKDGVIEGFDVKIKDDDTLFVSAGSAFIDKKFTELKTDSEIAFTKIEDVSIKVRSKYKPSFNVNLVQNIKHLSFKDDINPDPPSNVSVEFIDYFRIKISWEIKNKDVSYVNIYRDSYDDEVEDFSRSVLVQTSNENIFTDNDIEPSKKYIYYLESVDINGNYSNSYSKIDIFVPDENITPDPPKFMSVVVGNTRVQVIWSRPSYKNISGYDIKILEIDSSYSSIGDEISYITDGSVNNLVIKNLKKNTRYKIKMYSISMSGKYSASQEKLITTKEFSLEDEISYIYQNALVTNGLLGFNINWQISFDEYDDSDYDPSAIYKCRIIELELLTNAIKSTSDFIQLFNGQNSIYLTGIPLTQGGSTSTVSFSEKSRYLFGIFKIKDGVVSPGVFTYLGVIDIFPPEKPSGVFIVSKENGSIDVSISTNNPSDAEFFDIEIYEAKINNKIEDFSNVVLNKLIKFWVEEEDPNPDFVNTVRKIDSIIDHEIALYYYNYFYFSLSSDELTVEFDSQTMREDLGGSELDIHYAPGVSFKEPEIYWPVNGIKIKFSNSDSIESLFGKIVQKLYSVPVLSFPDVLSPTGKRSILFNKIINIASLSNGPAGIDCSYLYRFSRTRLQPNWESVPAVGDVESDPNDPKELFSYALYLNWIEPAQLNNIKINYDLSKFSIVAKRKVRDISLVNFNSSIVRPGYAYRADVYSIDDFNNKSEKQSGLIYLNSFEDLIPPESPISQSAYFVANRVVFSWIYPFIQRDISYFKIYRSTQESSSFYLLSTVKNNIFVYEDYEIESGKSYYYRVSAVDSWGKESLSESMNMSGFIFIPNLNIETSFNFNCARVGQDLVFSWDRIDDFGGDGVEILCRYPNSSQFITIYNSQFDNGDFSLSNIFLENGNYSFGIRSVSNQVEVFFDYSGDSSGMEIARVAKNFNDYYIEDSRRILKNMESPVLEETDLFLTVHDHLLTDSNDKRIDFSEIYRISDWSPVDQYANYKFSTSTDFPTRYSGVDLYLNGLKNIVLYEIDYNKKTITFSKSLWPNLDEPFYPHLHVFSSPVSIDLVFLGFSEVSEDLSYDKFGPLFAEQFDKGILEKTKFDTVEHSGRVNEELIPLQCICSSEDGYKYIISSNEQGKKLFVKDNIEYLVDDSGSSSDSMQDIPEDAQPSSFNVYDNPFICYDVFVVPNFFKSLIIYATSMGIYYSYSYDSFSTGVILESNPPFDFGPPIKIKYTPFGGRNTFSVIHARGFTLFEVSSNVNLSETPLINLIHTEFISGVSFVHDIIFEDNISYLSTNIGIYKFVVQVVQNAGYIPILTQMPLISMRSNEVFSCFVIDDQLFAIMSSGIYIYDKSGIWIMHFNLYQNDIIQQVIKKYQDGKLYYFLIGRRNVYRISKSDLSSSGDLFYKDYGVSTIYSFVSENIQSSCIYKEFLIIATDKNCFITSSSTSIYGSPSLKFKKFAHGLKYQGVFTNIYSIKTDTGDTGIGELYFAQEGRIIRAKSLSRFSTYIDFHNDKIGRYKFSVPSYYLNGFSYEDKIYLESSFSSQNPCVIYSKYKMDLTDRFSCVRDYSVYSCKNGGWAYHDFASSVEIKLNGRVINDGSRAKKPHEEILGILNVSLANFDDKISNYIVLEKNFNSLQKHIDYMTTNTTNNFNQVTERGIHRFTRSNIRKLLFYINKVNSSIYSPEVSREMGIYNSLFLPYPNFEVDILANVYKETDGDQGVTDQFLTDLGISFENYSIPERPGSLCTYDPEDKSYYLPPNVPISSICESSLSPNYQILSSDIEFGLSDDISGLSNFFTGIIPSGINISYRTALTKNWGRAIEDSENPGYTPGMGDGSSSTSGGGIF